MELKDLVGDHKLDAVDFSEESIKTYGDVFEDCQICRFRLDGIVYLAIEDPDDGYRSYMRDLKTDESAIMKNVFDPIDVVCHHRTKNRCDNDDILEVINKKTGKVILEVGIGNYDDYYPYFVANFRPENIGLI